VKSNPATLVRKDGPPKKKKKKEISVDGEGGPEKGASHRNEIEQE